MTEAILIIFCLYQIIRLVMGYLLFKDDWTAEDMEDK